MSMRRLTLASLATLVVLGGGSFLTNDAAVAAGPPEAPVAEVAQSITGTSAVWGGTVNPHAPATTSYYFNYGENGVCGEAPRAGEGEVTGEAVKVTFTVQNLVPSTKYAYCLVASNAGGETAASAPVEFETLGYKPVVSSESVSALTATAATLEARINPENQATTCVFRYESAKTAATTIPCQPGTLEGYGGGESNSEFYYDPLATASLNELTPGEAYSYRVIAENATGKTEGPPQTFTTVAPPKVNDQPPSVSTVTRTSALVFATIDAERDVTATYHIAYVAAAGYEPAATDPYGNGASSASLLVGAGSGDVSVGPQPLTGLLAGTTYHYALIATNSAGTVRGLDYTFTTAARTPPVVVTGAPGAVTQTSATISGTVDPDGLQTSYEFEVGVDGGYGGAQIFGNAGPDTGVETVSANLGELIPGVTYHYRMVATNEDGTTYGADQSFTIPAIPSPIPPGTATPLIPVPAIAFPPPGGGAVSTKSLTNAQKLADALKACRKKPKSKRATCEKQARKRYAQARAKTKKSSGI
jgi:hypothetical protein